MKVAALPASSKKGPNSPSKEDFRCPATSPQGVSRRTFTAGLGAAGLLAGTTPFNIVRAQGAPLKVGVLLPRSGFEAGIGQDCQRGVDIAAGVLKDMGLPALQIMNGDTESSVDVARSRAEKLIGEGAQRAGRRLRLRRRARRSRRSPSRRACPFIINIAAAPQITEQGYKFVFRNFPTARHDPRRRLRQSEGTVRAHRLGAEDASCSCTSTTRSARRCRRASAR